MEAKLCLRVKVEIVSGDCASSIYIANEVLHCHYNQSGSLFQLMGPIFLEWTRGNQKTKCPTIPLWHTQPSQLLMITAPLYLHPAPKLG